jgi:hypothetical protein
MAGMKKCMQNTSVVWRFVSGEISSMSNHPLLCASFVNSDQFKLVTIILIRIACWLVRVAG